MMQNPKLSKLKNLQALRGVAVLLVVGRHIIVFGERSIGPIDFCRDLFLSGDAGVDLFFVISGFVMVVTTIGKFQQPAMAGQFIFRRAMRIYPLYWLFSVLTLVIFLLHPELINRTGRGVQIHLLSSFFLWPQQGLPLLGQGWSLTYELYFYVVFTFLLFLAEERLSRGIVAWTLLIIGFQSAVLIGGYKIESPVIKTMFDPLVLEFIGGVLTAIAFNRGWIPRYGWWIMSLGVIGMAISGLIFHGDKNITEIRTTRFFVYGIPCIMIVFGAIAVELKLKTVLPMLLQRVGDMSYSIYLSHVLVIAGMARLWHKKAVATFWEQALMVLLMYGGVLVFGAISYAVVEKPMHEFFRRVSSGFRKKPVEFSTYESTSP